MKNIPELQRSIPVPDEVSQAAEVGDLVLFVGSGVSQRMGLPSWKTFASSVLDELVAKQILNYNEINALKNLEPRKILSIAKIQLKIHKENVDFTRFFRKKRRKKSDIYDKLNSIGCTFVTTNYDRYLEPSIFQPKHAHETQHRGKRIVSRDDLCPVLIDRLGNVVHLHGAIDKPETMIIGTADYLTHYDHKHVQKLLTHLFEFKTVVFLGYGLEESELLEHILRRGSVRRSEEQRVFSLQGFYSSQSPLYEKLCEYYEHEFGLRLIGYLMDDEEYACLDNIVAKWSEFIVVGSTSQSEDARFIENVLKQ